MPLHIKDPSRIKSAGNMPKIIDEFVGRVNTRSSLISIAKMTSPSGWEEPPQTPEFDEYTFVLRGAVHVKTDKEKFIVGPNELFIAEKGTTIQYSTPGPEGAEYVAICMPAFSAETVHRMDESG